MLMPAYDERFLIDVRLALSAGKILREELQSERCSDARSELQQLLCLDFEKLENIHHRGGNQVLLRKCYRPLHQVKRALLASSYRSPVVTSFLNAVRVVEQQPIWRTAHDEEVHQRMQSVWRKKSSIQDEQKEWPLFLNQFSRHLHQTEEYPATGHSCFLLPSQDVELKVEEFLRQ